MTTISSPFEVPAAYIQPLVVFADEDMERALDLNRTAETSSVCECCGRGKHSRRGRPRSTESVERDNRIMELLREVPYATKEEISAELNDNDSKVYAALRRLQNDSKIVMERLSGACQWRTVHVD